MSRSWKSYRHRFIPWLAWNWSGRQIKSIDSTVDLQKETLALSQLTQLVEHLDKEIPELSVKEWRSVLKQPDEMAKLARCGRDVMREVFQFELTLKESHLEGGGRGVFLSKGRASKGQIVGLYPGTVYLPFEPLFFQSIRNPFIFRCADGWSIDGHHRALSRLMYRSCAFRDVIGHSMSCDLSWLSTNPINPLSIGQFVNNHTRDIASNVEYVEINVPADFPLPWRRFLPNVFYSGAMATEDDERLLRCVALLSTREVASGEELYSSYLTLVTSQR